eukprot:scaffold13685_cov61-Phaeocystis_antarctica.AAC.2
MKPAMQACLLVPIVPTPLPRASRTLYLHFTSLRPPSASVLHLLPCTQHTRALPPFGPRTPSNSLTNHAHFRNPPRPAFASQDFVKANTNILRRFRLTGTASTMKMLRSVMGEGIEYGPTCASGPLGGDAQ